VTGDKHILPGGHEAIEIDGSTAEVLRVRIIQPGDQWLQNAQSVARVLCTRAPMRYFDGKTGRGN
jgi:hypothetical protein